MSNSLERFLAFAEDREDIPEMVMKSVCFDMAQVLEIDPIAWRDLYGAKLEQMIKEDKALLEKLSNEGTYSEAVDFLKQKLYH